MMTMQGGFFGFVTSVAVLCASLPCFGQEWPELRPFHVATGVNFEGEKAFLSVPFFDREDIIRYRLICRGVKESHLDYLKLNYVGPWMCILNEKNRETEFSLLDKPDFSPWHGRGRFSNKELIGSCGHYPEYGRVRHFRLRGFVLTLALTDVDVHDDEVLYGVFKVSVKPDPSATSKYAETPKYIDPFDPGRSCEKVLLRNGQGK